MAKLTMKDKTALRWAARKADQWYGSVTGDAKLESHHIQQMDKVQDALLKLGIKIHGRYA